MTDGAKKKILIVDDEKSVRTYLQTLLQDEGYDTVLACDGQEGIDKAKEEKPDLVTLDISMPEKSGVRFYRELRGDADLAGIPVIIVTAVTGYGGKPEEFEKFISTRKQIPPPEGFVAKPIKRDKFLSILHETLNA